MLASLVGAVAAVGLAAGTAPSDAAVRCASPHWSSFPSRVQTLTEHGLGCAATGQLVLTFYEALDRHPPNPAFIVVDTKVVGQHRFVSFRCGWKMLEGVDDPYQHVSCQAKARGWWARWDATS